MFTENEIEFIKFALALNTDSDDSLRLETMNFLDSGRVLGSQHYELILKSIQKICPEEGPKRQVINALCEKIVAEMGSKPHGLLS